MSTATLVYDIPQGFSANATIVSQAAAVPVPLDVVADMYGLRVTADTTAAGGTGVTRTIVMISDPTVNLNATTTLIPGDLGAGSPIGKVTIIGSGLNYILPPELVLSGGKPFKRGKLDATLAVDGASVLAGGGSYNGGTFVAITGAMRPLSLRQTRQAPLPERSIEPNAPYSPVPCCVQGLSFNAGGIGYSAQSVVEFQGGLAQGGTVATATLTRNATTGTITSITLTNPGSGYVFAPKVFIHDPVIGGSGANITAIMGVGTPAVMTPTIMGGVITAITVNSAGSGYIGVPTVTVIDPAGMPGTGAIILPRMGVGAIEIVDPGSGYSVAPTITAVTTFNTYFPTAASRARPLANLMATPISQAVSSPLLSTPVVIT